MDEPHATVHISMANQTTGATKTRTLTTPIALGATVALPTVTFGVKPGTTYVLTITIVLPPGQTSAAGTATQTTLQVAPGYLTARRPGTARARVGLVSTARAWWP